MSNGKQGANLSALLTQASAPLQQTFTRLISQIQARDSYIAQLSNRNRDLEFVVQKVNEVTKSDMDKANIIRDLKDDNTFKGKRIKQLEETHVIDEDSIRKFREHVSYLEKNVQVLTDMNAVLTTKLKSEYDSQKTNCAQQLEQVKKELMTCSDGNKTQALNAAKQLEQANTYVLAKEEEIKRLQEEVKGWEDIETECEPQVEKWEKLSGQCDTDLKKARKDIKDLEGLYKENSAGSGLLLRSKDLTIQTKDDEIKRLKKSLSEYELENSHNALPYVNVLTDRKWIEQYNRANRIMVVLQCRLMADFQLLSISKDAFNGVNVNTRQETFSIDEKQTVFPWKVINVSGSDKDANFVKSFNELLPLLIESINDLKERDVLLNNSAFQPLSAAPKFYTDAWIIRDFLNTFLRMFHYQVGLFVEHDLQTIAAFEALYQYSGSFSNEVAAVVQEAEKVQTQEFKTSSNELASEYMSVVLIEAARLSQNEFYMKSLNSVFEQFTAQKEDIIPALKQYTYNDTLGPGFYPPNVSKSTGGKMSQVGVAKVGGKMRISQQTKNKLLVIVRQFIESTSKKQKKELIERAGKLLISRGIHRVGKPKYDAETMMFDWPRFKFIHVSPQENNRKFQFFTRISKWYDNL